MVQPVEIQIPPRSAVRTDTLDCYLRSMSFYHDRACTGSASSSRPRTGLDHHGVVSHDRQRLRSLPCLPSYTARTKDVLLSTSPLPSATACCNHACCCSPCHHGAMLHAPHSTNRLSASDIRGVCTVSLVSSASAIPPFYVHGRCERIGKTPPPGIKKRSISAPFHFCHLNHSTCKIKSQYTFSTLLVHHLFTMLLVLNEIPISVLFQNISKHLF